MNALQHLLLLLCAVARAEHQQVTGGENTLCTNTCMYKMDGDCDDGGPGSEFTGMCQEGSDCQDCGPRVVTFYAPPGQAEGTTFTVADPPNPPPEVQTCLNTCSDADGNSFGNDGYCDDGGPGSEFAVCAQSGTDCADCGERGATMREKADEYIAQAGELARNARDWLIAKTGLSQEAINGLAAGIPGGWALGCCMGIFCGACCCGKKGKENRDKYISRRGKPATGSDKV